MDDFSNSGSKWGTVLKIGAGILGILGMIEAGDRLKKQSVESRRQKFRTLAETACAQLNLAYLLPDIFAMYDRFLAAHTMPILPLSNLHAEVAAAIYEVATRKHILVGSKHIETATNAFPKISVSRWRKRFAPYL
jgi:hypothetical protein